MILWLNTCKRMKNLVPPLNRIGFLSQKKYTIHRKFDHIALSLFTGDVCVSVKDQTGFCLLQAPSCVIALPGDIREVVPLHPVDEFYIVYDAIYEKEIFPVNASDFKRILPLKNYPLLEKYSELIRQLMDWKITAGVISQFDLLGYAMLENSFLEPCKQTAEGEKLNVFERELYKHYHEKIDWNKLSRENGMSYSTIRRLWLLHHNTTPHEFVMDLRNKEACELLKDISLTIKEISNLIGYDDPHYFSRFFIRRNGCTPSEYREKYQQTK